LIDRRQLLILTGAAVSLAGSGKAAETNVPKRLGLLFARAEDDLSGQAFRNAFWAGMSKQGWPENRLVTRYHWSADTTATASSAAADLIAFGPDVLFGAGSPCLLALAQATKSVPIVFAYVGDVTLADVPGVGSFDRPSRNVTGFAVPQNDEYFRTSLDLLSQMMPGIEAVAALYNPDSVPGGEQAFVASIAAYTASHGLQLVKLPVRSLADLSAALGSAAANPQIGLYGSGDPWMVSNRAEVLGAVADRRIIAVWGQAGFATAGVGLIGYSPDPVPCYAGAGEYAARILNGEALSGLSIQEAPAVLAVNLNEARAIGVSVPDSILAQADLVVR
jgi:putative ABC transport system substrate-binding protein